MATFRERNNPVRIFGKRLLLLAIILAILLMIPGVWKVYTKERESRVLKNEALQELSGLRERADRLRKETERLDTQYGLEAALREQYSLAREGEKLIVIVNTPVPADSVREERNLTRWFEDLLRW